MQLAQLLACSLRQGQLLPHPQYISGRPEPSPEVATGGFDREWASRLEISIRGVVLRNGAVPLAVLDREVTGYLAEQTHQE